MLRYLIFDKERRRIVVDGLETHAQANAKLAELIAADPEAQSTLLIFGSDQRELGEERASRLRAQRTR